ASGHVFVFHGAILVIRDALAATLIWVTAVHVDDEIDPYHLAADSNNVISKKYGTYGLKKFMGKEYMGINRTTFLINKNGKIIRIFNKVKPMGHSNEVLEAFGITN
ncbi:MAG TPA: hypothetical protein VI146_08200, partial [Nitrososphaeraceae archaeon]